METPASEKLSIAIVNDAVTDCIAGSFISTLRFAERLSARGHNVIFIAARSVEHPVSDYHKNIRVYRFRSVLLPKTEGQIHLCFPKISELKKIFTDEKVTVVHVMIPTFSAVAALKASKSLGIPSVAHSHTQPENIFLHLPSFLPVTVLNRVFYLYLKWLYGKSDAIIFPSTFSKNRFSNFKTDARRQEVITNGVDTTVFHPASATSFFEKFGLNRSQKHILYLGRLHPEKSVDTLLRAVPLILQKAPNTHFLIAGFGHLRQELERIAANLEVSKNITFCGKLSDEDVVHAYNASDIYVLPSLAELEGMTVLEAMACGKPILIANAPESAARYFVDGNGLLFEPENAADLAAKAITLLTDTELLSCSAARSLSKSHEYDIRQSVLRLEALYLSLRRAHD